MPISSDRRRTAAPFVRGCVVVVAWVVFTGSTVSQGLITAQKNLELRCSVNQSFVNSLELLKKARQVSGILEELSARREDFLRNGDPVDLFPALYFSTTAAEFRNVLLNNPNNRMEMLEMMIVFYDSYKLNRDEFEKRGIGSVEAHWRKYYKNAAKARASKSHSTSQIVEILLDGIDAHVIDLSRAVRFVIAHRNGPTSDLKLAFDSMNAIFPRITKNVNEDIVNALKSSTLLLSTDKTFGVGSTYIVYAREKAWDLAVSGKRLRTRRPQPILAHRDDSRVYIPLDYNGSACAGNKQP